MPHNMRSDRSVPIARTVGKNVPISTETPSEVLKVSTRSRPSAVAGAIAGVIRDSGVAEVQSVGAGATNQAIKAIVIARSYLNEEGTDIMCVPSFIDVSIEEEERTAIRFLVSRQTDSFLTHTQSDSSQTLNSHRAIKESSTLHRQLNPNRRLSIEEHRKIINIWNSIPLEEQYLVWLTLTVDERDTLLQLLSPDEQQLILASLSTLS